MGDVNKGTKTSLAANLNNAIIMLGKYDRKSIERLEKLIDTIETQLLPKGRLSNEQAEYIINELERSIILINTPEVITPPTNDTIRRAEGIETRITSSISSFYPVIYGDWIIWNNYYSESLSLFNVSSAKEFIIAPEMSLFNLYSHAIHEDRVIWTGLDINYIGIKLYNISTNATISIHEVQAVELAIYKDVIVWQDYRNGNWDIYMYNLSLGEEVQITTNESRQREPDIYGDKIVWVDERDVIDIYMSNTTLPEIYIYDIPTGEELRVTEWAYADYTFTETIWRESPAIYENRIVWSDGRGGMDHFDIFMFTLEGQVSQSPVDSKTTEESFEELSNETLSKALIDSSIEDAYEEQENTTNQSTVDNTSEEIIENITEEQNDEPPYEIENMTESTETVENVSKEKSDGLTEYTGTEQSTEPIEEQTDGSAEETAVETEEEIIEEQ